MRLGALLVLLLWPACSSTQGSNGTRRIAATGVHVADAKGTHAAGAAGSSQAGAGASAAAIAGSAAAGTRDTASGGAGAAAGSAGTNDAGSAGTNDAGSAGTNDAGSAGAPARTPSVLVFTRTTGYRHASIPDGIAALTRLGSQRGWLVSASEDPTLFGDASLAAFNVVVFLSTSGDILDDQQQAAFERFIEAGNGFVGIHSASDTEYDWAWYGALVGAYFSSHPDIQPARVIVEDATQPATQGLPMPWQRSDEWYAFSMNPRPNVNVLLRLDESSYAPGASSMGADHPIAWYHLYDGGRAFYTALGHTSESYSEPAFLSHISGAVEWAASR